MNIITNTFRIHSDHFIGSIATKLTPFQKQVSMIALATLALFTCYFVYRRCWQPQTQLNTAKKNSPQQGNVSEAQQKALKDSPEKKTADTNANQTRFIVHKFYMETKYTTGQDRELHLDAEGRLQGITKQRRPLRDCDVQWLHDQAQKNSTYRVPFNLQNDLWVPKNGAAFKFTAAKDTLPDNIRSIADMTLAKLNQLAAGAFKIAESKQSTNWIEIFEQKAYADDDLLAAVKT